MSENKYDLKRYDLFGWDYGLINKQDEKEVSWHVDFARETDGPVLGLACGTAGLLVELARAGFDAEGIDLSTGMLDVARRKIAEQPPEIAARITLHNLDMTDFNLDKKFGLIFIADNSFREMKTAGDHLACLRCVRQHLNPTGKFLVTERRFDPTWYEGGVRVLDWSEPVDHPESGEAVSRRVEVELAEDGAWITGTMFYRTVHADGRETVEECPFDGPVMKTGEYVDLFARAGFETEVFVGYQRVADDGEDPTLCFVCTPKGSE